MRKKILCSDEMTNLLFVQNCQTFLPTRYVGYAEATSLVNVFRKICFGSTSVAFCLYDTSNYPNFMHLYILVYIFTFYEM